MLDAANGSDALRPEQHGSGTGDVVIPMLPISPGIQKRVENMRKMFSQQPEYGGSLGGKTALPGKGPVLLKSGQIQPGSGRESDTNPDGVTDARSSKTWQRLLAWAERQQNRMGFPEPSPAKTWAEASFQCCRSILASAKAADTSASLASSAAVAKASQEEATPPRLPRLAECGECRRETGSNAD